MTDRADDRSRGEARTIAPRAAYLAIGSVFVGFAVDAFLYVLLGPWSAVGTVLAGLALVTIAAAQIGVLSNPRVRSSSPRARAALIVVFLLAFGPVAAFGPSWFGVLGFPAGGALLVLGRRVRWWVFFAVCVGAGTLMVIYTGDSASTVYVVCITAVTGLTIDGLSRLRLLTRRLQVAQDELAAVSASRERLRFARDVQVLVGDQLSRIEVLGQLVLRILRRRPDQADGELTEIARVAQRALANVRSVASGYREQSLEQTLTSVQSILEASQVEVTTRQDTDDLPSAVQALGSTLLHEAVDALMAHTQVSHCGITCALVRGELRLELVHDGVALGAEPEPGLRLQSPAAEQARDAGGSVAWETLPDGRLRFRARVPLDRYAWLLSRFSRSADRGEAVTMEPSTARRLLQAVLLGHTINSLIFLAQAGAGPGRDALAVVCLLGVVGLQVGYFSRSPDPPSGPRAITLLGVQAVLVALPIVVLGDPLLGLPGFLAGSAMLVLRPRFGIPVLLVVVGAVATAQVLLGGGPTGVSYGILATLDHGLVIYGLGRMRGVVAELRATRTGLTAQATASERLRFARDLHDLLGLGLSAISLKTAVAQRLLAVAPVERVQHEVEEIVAVTRRARYDARSVTHRYRLLSLEDEIASVRSVLAAAEIELDMRLPATSVPPGVETVLATVLREAVCNVLRHSDAQRCEVTISIDETVARVGVVNDRPRLERSTPGNGIGNLSARLREVSGELETGRHPDRTFRLAASVPLGAVTPPADPERDPDRGPGRTGEHGGERAPERT